MAELRQRIDQLELELGEGNSSNESLRTELAKAELKLEGNQDLVHEIKSNHNQIEASNTNLQKENQEMSMQITKLSTQLDGEQSVNELMKQQSSGFESRSQDLLSIVNKLEANNKTSHSELTENRNLIQSQNEKIGALQELNEQQKKYIGNLEADVKRMEEAKAKDSEA